MHFENTMHSQWILHKNVFFMNSANRWIFILKASQRFAIRKTGARSRTFHGPITPTKTKQFQKFNLHPNRKTLQFFKSYLNLMRIRQYERSTTTLTMSNVRLAHRDRLRNGDLMRTWFGAKPIPNISHRIRVQT